MSRETTTLVDDLKQDATESFDPKAMRSTGSTANASPSVNGAQPVAASTWNERMKGLFAKLGKALEGDHEIHKYRGM